MADTLVPPCLAEDDDEIVVALETARVEEERGSPGDAARWVQRAAGAARKQGRPIRAGDLSRAQARLADRASHFEKIAATEHVLATEDDFSEQTIVDSPPDPRANASRKAEVVADAPGELRETSPPARADPPRAELEHHKGLRVGVRRLGEGKLDVRLLHAGEVPVAGEEEEALLIPLRAGAELVS